MSNDHPSVRLFTCPIRLTLNGVSITSPKTGRTVACPNTAAPIRIRGRILAARAIGKETAEFTADELRAFLASVPKPQPIHGGWHRRTRRGR